MSLFAAFTDNTDNVVKYNPTVEKSCKTRETIIRRLSAFVFFLFFFFYKLITYYYE